MIVAGPQIPEGESIFEPRLKGALGFFVVSKVVEFHTDSKSRTEFLLLEHLEKLALGT